MDADLDVMTAETDCLTCGVGTFCPVGAAAETPCAAGTYSDQAEVAMCSNCEAGTFQPLEGQTACGTCTEGSYCVAGAAAAAVPLRATASRG